MKHAPRTVGMIFSDAFHNLKEESNKITRVVFYLWLLPSLPMLVSFFSVLPELVTNMDRLEATDEISSEFAIQIFTLVPSILFFIFFAIWGYATIISIAVRYREGEELSVREHAMEMIKGPMWSIIAIAICSTIAMIIVLIPVELLIDVETTGGVLIYNFINIALSVVVQTLLFISSPALIHQGRGPLFGVNESINLTKRFFSQTLFRSLAFGFCMAITMIAMGIIGVIAIAAIKEGHHEWTLVELLTIFIGLLPLLLTGLFFIIYDGLYRTEVYFDLRVENGLDQENDDTSYEIDQASPLDLNRFQR